MKRKTYYSIFLFLSLLLFSVSNSFGQCATDVPVTERDALMALYNATGGANWTNNTNWGTTAFVCDWYGVTVANGSVTAINLSNNQLNGTIPTELGNLSNLASLSLFGNQLSGAIPTQLGNLLNLSQLYLSSNQLSGAIPPELGNLSNLFQLLLNNNQLSGAIPPELGNLSNLFELSLYNNQLSGTIPSELGNLSNLSGLILNSNQLTGAIPTELSAISNLSTFKFESNRFVFIDLESGHSTYTTNLTNYIYSPQSKVDQVETPTVVEGTSYTFTTSLSSPNNSYQWYKDGVAITGATSKDYTINPVALTDAGVYHVLVTNSIVTGLTLERNTVTITINAQTDTQAPTAPILSSTAQTDTTADLSWTAAIDNTAVTGYKVYKDAVLETTLGNVLSYQVTGLTASTAYNFTVIALDAAGNESVISNTVALSTAANCGVPVAERDALMALYNATGGANWTNTIANNQPWDINISVCDWYGVTVTNGTVTKLSLALNQLSGPLPSELVNLPNLTSLIFRDNQLTGTILPTLGGLSNLETLDLHNCYLTGTIPSTLGGLSNLKTLFLHVNQLTGVIPTELGNLPNIQSLYLHGNLFNGVIPPTLSTIASLKTFWFYNNSFIFSNFESEHNVYSTNLTNYIYSPQAKVDQIETPTILEGNSYTFTTSLISPNNSYQWYKDGVAITGATSKDYTINPVALTDAGVYHVLVANSIVTGLTLERNTITLAVTADTCGVSISERDALMTLYNATGGANWTNTLANNQPWDINIPVCSWYGVTVTSGTVTWLDLNGNNLIGTLPSQLNGLPSLEGLFLYNNQISGTIPGQLGDLLNLKYLNLNTNQLGGAIPIELGSLLLLKHLYLSNNQLTGSIPGSLGGLSSLWLLGLNSNQLEGAIPAQLGNLSSLQTLYLYNNQLTESIPSSLGDLSALKKLHLDSNQLSGSIPSNLGNLSNLTNMTLNNNQLTGEIPSALGNLSLLQYLQLQSNQLEGPLPSTLGNLSSLIYLYLETNQLSGSIPPSVSLIPSLDRFRFQENAFIFNDFETEHNTYATNISGYSFSPQAKVDQIETPTILEGNSYTFTTSLSSPNNSYQWYKDGVAITGATSKDYTINPVALTDVGVYHVLATNSIVTGLTLERNTITLAVTADTCGVSTVERDALMALYNATGGANWTNTLANNQPWDINISVCDWYGVTVTNGSVTTLNLASNQLLGNLPTSLGDLTYLQYLSLNNNQITGNIPSTLGNLTSLVNLRLNHNQLTGAIPLEMGNMSSLRWLGLNDNQITGSIPSSLGSLLNLTHLYLSDNQLTGNIPDSLDGLANLTHLYLFDNQLTGNIPNTLGSLSKLKYMHLNGNQLTGNIPSDLGNLSSLLYLYLDANQLIGAIPSQLGNLAALQRLRLNNNQLNGIIPTELSTLSNLITFNFQSNGFIFSNFENEHNTYTTNLTTYNYSPQAKVDQIETPTVIEGNSYTFTTSLSSPNNSYQWYKDGVAITGATSKDYTINSVALTDVGVYHVLATNSIVIGLTLERNTVTLSITPCGVSTTERDALLALYNATGGSNWTNTLANNKPWDINISVCGWYGVTVTNGTVTGLALSNNQLSGSIAPELGNLSNLVSLYLYTNQLTGNIPYQLGNLSNLAVLNLNNNQLKGTIPTQLGDLSNLVRLYLSNNQLVGGIPQEIVNISNLFYLDCGQNQLTGSLPEGLGNLTDLHTINFNNNKLTGPIPSTFGNLINLRNLYLRNNQLTGVIPTGLGNLALLRVLWLDINQLTGQIPTQLGNLTNLKALRLNSNQLTDSIPATLTNLINLQHLYVDNNQLSGPIPSFLGIIPPLVDLRFSNNAFIFNDFESEHGTYTGISKYYYSPQAKIDQVETRTVTEGSSVTLTVSLISLNNSYQWYKDGVAIVGVGATNKDYTLNSIALADVGAYHVVANNSIVTGLTLERHPINLIIAGLGQGNTFCVSDWGDAYPTVGDLTPSGTNIVWYPEAIGGAAFNNTDEINDEAEYNGVFYYWDDTTDNINTFTEALVTIYPTPEGETEQSFSIYASPAPTISDIEIFNNGEPVYWYATSSSTTELSAGTALVDGQTYYASSCNTVDATCLCRLAVTVTVGVIAPKGDLVQYLCLGATLNDIVVVTENSLSLVWYSTETGGTPLDVSTNIIDGITYYVAQKDISNGAESLDRLPVLVNVSTIPDITVKQNNQIFYVDQSQTVGDLHPNNANIIWYSQAEGGNAYSNTQALENGRTYYAEQATENVLCPSIIRLEVTVTLSTEVADPLLGCELFRPELLDRYVIDAWLNERDVTTEVISAVPFNESKESKLFVTLLNHLKNRLLSKDKDLQDIPKIYEPILTAEEAQVDLAPLMSFIEGIGTTEKKLIVYDFNRINDAYGRAIGFSFYLNAGKTHQFIYNTPKIVRNGVEQTDHYPLQDNISNITNEFLKFTKVEVVASGEFKIYSDFNQVTTPAHQKSQEGLLSTTGAIKSVSTFYKYNEVAYQASATYNNAKIEVSFVDVNDQLIGAPIILQPQGSIIDKWQKVSANFIIPADAGRMIITLKNDDPNRIAYFDDLRIHPFEANMKTFVYHPENQRLMSELDENNYATFYEYDLEGGLVRVKKETEEGIYTIQETRSGNLKKAN